MYSPELLTIFLLLLVPILAAVFLAIFKNNTVRAVVVTAASVILIGGSIFLASFAWSQGLETASVTIPWLWTVLFIVELAVVAIIIGLAIKYKKILPLILGIVQAVLLFVLEFAGIAHNEANITFTLNNFSLIMVLIIGIIGSLICVYALGYMKDYTHHNTEVKDRRRYFFVILFLFLFLLLLFFFGLRFVPKYEFWAVCCQLGIEKVFLKAERMVIYLPQKNERYYQSKTFERIIRYAISRADRCSMKEEVDKKGQKIYENCN